MSTIDDLDTKPRTLDDKDDSPIATTLQHEFALQEPQPEYRLYKRRWFGLVALVRAPLAAVLAYVALLLTATLLPCSMFTVLPEHRAGRSVALFWRHHYPKCAGSSISIPLVLTALVQRLSALASRRTRSTG